MYENLKTPVGILTNPCFGALLTRHSSYATKEFFLFSLSVNHPDIEEIKETDTCLDKYYASILNNCVSTAFCFEEEDNTLFDYGDNDEILCDHETTAEVPT